jgi:hypothetical protein
VACGATTGNDWPADPAADEAADRLALSTVETRAVIDLCDRNAAPVHCYAKAIVMPAAGSGGPIGGYGPSDLASAYNIPPSAASGGLTVAIVDAFDDPTAEADLAIYRNQYKLPACTTANGCFKKVNESGEASPLPPANAGWSSEISLDLDMVSAACPDCKILLVEAQNADVVDLGTAANTAANLGAAAISNSYGGAESSAEGAWSDTYYKHPGVLVTVSSGDSHYGAAFPASSPYVLAVGGTTLTKSNSSRGWAEAAWSGGGAGCSAYLPKPSWQTNALCQRRTETDVSAIADPNTGVAVVVNGIWQVYGGTSASSPFVAALFTRLGIAAASASVCKTGACNPFPYAHPTSLYDITLGSDGTCGGSALCAAGPGYDGPTGLGTPNGAALVAPAAAPPADAGPFKDAAPSADASNDGGAAPKDAATPKDAAPTADAAPAAPPFTLRLSSMSVSVSQGKSVTDSAIIESTANLTAPVSLSVGGVPPGMAVTASSGPNAPGTATVVLTFSTNASMKLGVYPLTIDAQAGSTTQTATVTVTVTH